MNFAFYATRHRSGSVIITPPTGVITTDPYRRYGLVQGLNAYPPLFGPHWFTPHMLSDRQLVSTLATNSDGTRTDGYDTAYLNPPDRGIAGVGQAGAEAWGGFWRNRPRKPGSDGENPDLGFDWLSEQHRTQILQTHDAGCDLGFVECLSSVGGSQWTWQLDWYDQVEALGLVGKFWCIPTLDTSGFPGADYNGKETVAYTEADVTARLSAMIDGFKGKPAQLIVGGRVQVLIFAPEDCYTHVVSGLAAGATAPVTGLKNGQRSAQNLAAAERIFAAVKADQQIKGTPVDLYQCYVGNLTSLAPAFDPSSAGHGRWGDRDPVSTGGSGSTARGMPAYVKTTFSKPAVHWWAPSDCRPDGLRYWEYAGTMQWRVNVDAIINRLKPAGMNLPPVAGVNLASGYQGGGPGDTVCGVGTGWMCQRAASFNVADVPYVQMPTWNDYSEDAVIEPSRNFGWFFADTIWYYATAAKLGYYPDILDDCIWLSHRTEFSGGTLGANAAIGATTLNLATKGTYGIFSAGQTFPTNCTFPFTWSVGTGAAGEQVTVTGISGSGNSYTLTCSALTKAHTAGVYLGPMHYTYAPMTTPQVMQVNTAPVDLIEAYVHTAGPAGDYPKTLTINAGGAPYSPVSSTFSLTQPGVWVFTRALVAGGPGSISATLSSKAGVVLQSITSPWAVSHTQRVMDKPIRGGTSRRGWSSSYPYPIPNQSAITIT